MFLLKDEVALTLSEVTEDIYGWGWDKGCDLRVQDDEDMLIVLLKN